MLCVDHCKRLQDQANARQQQLLLATPTNHRFRPIRRYTRAYNICYKMSATVCCIS